MDSNSVTYPNSQTCTVQWNNTADNTNPKKIAVTVTYTYSVTVNNTTESRQGPNTQSSPITVRHIGSIGNIAINGTTVAKGGTYNELACATSSITVSAATPSTFPSQAVEYRWVLPNGWTTPNSTTSSNTITVTPNLAGGGLITVFAKRIDSYVEQSASILITRPQFSTPTFTSYGTSQAGSFDERILCSATTFEVTGGNATGYLWQGSGGVSASGTGNSGFISGNADGEVKVYPQSACGTGSQYAYMKVKVSSPDASQFVVANTPYGAPIDNSANTQYFPICKGTPTFVRFFPKGATSSTLELLPGSYGNSIELWGAGAIIGTTNTGYSVVRATANNCFGSSSHVKYFNIMNCGSYYSSYSISPNPTSSLLAVTYDDQTTDDNLPDNITLYDKNGKEYFSEDVKKNAKKKLLKDKKVSIDVSHFPKGIYFLHIRDTENPDTSKQLEKIRVIVE